MPKRVGIYSGTFDPVHDGHIAFAEAAIAEAHLDRVFFLVEPRPRRKQGVKAFEHRVAMVKLAIAKHPKLGVIMLEQSRFTVHETLPVLTARFKGAELSMLMGDDVLKHLTSWPHVEELVSSVKIVIGLRENSTRVVAEQLKNLQNIRNFTPDLQVFRTNASEYNSTKIRRSLRYGREVSGLDPKVLQYIQREGLYTPQPEI